MKCITGSIARGLNPLPVLYQSEKDYIPIFGRIFDRVNVLMISIVGHLEVYTPMQRFITQFFGSAIDKDTSIPVSLLTKVV